MVGARCLVDPASGLGACSIDHVDSCLTHECAVGFVCREGQCLNACDLVTCPDRACVEGACIPIVGDAGPLPDAAVAPDAGQPSVVRLTIETDADDGEIDGIFFDPQGETGNLDYAGYGALATRAYLRFHLPSGIPMGARIVQAHLEVEGTGGWGTCGVSDHLGVRADDVMDPPAVGAATDYPGGATGGAATTALVLWGPVLDWAAGPQRSPDISTVVQELVDHQSGLAAGTHVRIWVWAGDYTSGCEASWQDSSLAGSTPAVLEIAWVPG